MSEEHSHPSVPLGTRDWLCHEEEKGSGYSKVASMGRMEVTG
jgi:hypothetical protein